MAAHLRLAIVAGLSEAADSKSPTMHAAAARDMQIDLRYARLPIATRSVAEIVGAAGRLGFDGLNVTAPHKRAAALACSTLTDAARISGAVNCIAFRNGEAHGYAWDGVALWDAVTQSTLEGSTGFHAYVLGAGGTGAQVAHVLGQRGCSVTVVNRTAAAAQELVQRLAEAGISGADALGLEEFRLLPIHDAAHLLVCCLAEPAVPSWIHERMGPHTVVADYAYRADGMPTGTTEMARSKSVFVIDGPELLARQGAHSLELWSGHAPPLEVMLRAART